MPKPIKTILLLHETSDRAGAVKKLKATVAERYPKHRAEYSHAPYKAVGVEIAKACVYA